MKYKKFVVLLVFVLFVFITSCSNTCKDENVSMLLNGTGYFQTEPVKTEPKVKWKYQIGDAGDPIGFTLKNDILFFETHDNIYAVDAKSGKEIWKFKLTEYGINYLQPIVANGIVYYGAIKRFYAIDVKTGQEKWSFKLNEDDGNIYTTAAVACNTLFFGTSNYLYALNTKDGKLKWKSKVDEKIFGAPLIKNNLVYFTGSKNLYAVNIKDGKLKWKFNLGSSLSPILDENSYFPYNNYYPVLDDKNIYLGNSEGNFFAIDLKTGLKKWKYKAEWGVSSPAIANGIVYFVSCEGYDYDDKTFLYAINAETGEKLWKLSYKSGADYDYFHIQPTVADGIVYFIHSFFNKPNGKYGHGDVSTTFLEAIDAKTGKKLWRKSLGKVTIYMPYILVNKGVIYIVTQEKIEKYGGWMLKTTIYALK